MQRPLCFFLLPLVPKAAGNRYFLHPASSCLLHPWHVPGTRLGSEDAVMAPGLKEPSLVGDIERH